MRTDKRPNKILTCGKLDAMRCEKRNTKRKNDECIETNDKTKCNARTSLD